MSFPQLRSRGPKNTLAYAQQVTLSITAELGEFTWTGTAADLEVGYRLSAESGSFSWNGTDANLTETLSENDRMTVNISKYRLSYPKAFRPPLSKPMRFAYPAQLSISAESGDFSWLGTDAALIQRNPGSNSQRVKGNRAWPRPFAPSPFGQLRSERTLNLLVVTATTIIQAEFGTFSWTGSDTALRVARKVTADSGTFSWTGIAATLRKGHTLTADSGAYNWTGTDATLRVTRKIDSSAGSYEWIGTSADLRRNRIMAADSGSYSWTGTAATLKYGRYLSADEGDYIFLFGDADLQWSAQPTGGGGRMMLLGVG